MRNYIVTLALLLFSGFALAQEIKTDLPTILPPSPTVAALMKFEEVPVSNYTGVPDVSIPLYSTGTRSKDINLNLSLSYHPSGINANERASDVGLGWSLLAGGTVSRTVRGLADEYHKSGSTTNKVGIYWNTDPTNPNHYYEYLDILDNGAANSTEEYIEQEFAWESNEKGKYDTEHDLWQYNFMGFSGRFIIKKNTTTGLLEVVKMDNSTVKIINTYDTSNTTSKYTPISFTIYDDKGNRYVFDVVEVTKQNSTTLSYGNVIFPAGEGFYVDPFALSSSVSPTTTYKSAFHLSKIYDNNNKLVIDFSYNNDLSAYKENTIDETIKTTRLTSQDETILVQGIAEAAMIGGCPDGLGVVGKIQPKQLIVKSSRSTTVKKLDTINVYGKAKIYLTFEKGREDENFHRPDSAYVFKQLVIKDWDNNSIRKVNLNHHYSDVLGKRLMLSDVVFSNFQNATTEKYILNYKQNTSSLTPSKDYWGYFNLIPSGYMGGSYRAVDPDFCSTDVLQKMTLPIGGCVIFDFEANRYSYEGDTALTNFDDNPDNWNHTTVSHNFISTTTTIQNLTYSASNNQKVTFYPTDDFGDDAGITLYKDGNPVASYANIKCPTGIPDCGIEYTLLAGSQYGLKIWSIIGTVSTEMDVVYHTRKTVIDSCLYGGGVRIKRLGYFADGTTAQDFYENTITTQPEREKNFTYTFFGTSRSSGSLSFPRPLYTYSEEQDPGVHCNGIGSLSLVYDVATDFNNLSPVKTQGADIGYQEVTVSETGNGKSEYTYTSPIDYPESDFSFSIKPPFRASENFDYKRGLLTKEKIYHNDGRALTETTSGYTFDNHIEVTGVKFFYHPTNCPESFRYVDYDQFKYCTDNTPSCNTALGNINCGNDAADFIGNEKVSEAFGWAKLTSKTIKNFFYAGGGSTASTVQTDETYSYNTTNKKLSESTVTNSEGATLKTKYYYHSGNSTYSQNRISEIEKIETYRGTELLSTSQLTYGNSWYNNVSYLPNIITTAKGAQSLENRVRFNAYDDYSNPTEMQQEGGSAITYLWGYNKTQPIAKIENATNTQVATALSVASVNLINESNMSAIDALRSNSSLANAFITTYTYTPLVGVATITDPKGDKLTYGYDEFQRLKTIKDADNYILSENKYYYRANNSEWNYVQTTAYKTATTSSISTPTITQAAISKTFFDGLGRAVQQVAHQQSNTGTDIVTPIVYDAIGRQAKEYMPYPNASASLNYNSSALTDQPNYTEYSGQVSYSEKVFEPSPLNRVIEQAAPGNDWSLSSSTKHTIRMDYQTNVSNEVRYFSTTASGTGYSTNGYYSISVPTDNGYYAANQLYKTITKNENWESGDGDNNTTVEFKDKEGRIILKRNYGVSVVSGSETNVAHDTYYVYDQYNNLTYVLPPLADGTITQTVLDNMCYQYKYDKRNRMVEKKLPAKQLEYIVYDKLDRVIAAGPTLSPFPDASANTYGWTITKYDGMGRNILTGWTTGTNSSAQRKTFQDNYDGATTLFETRTTSATTINNVSFKYTNASLPTSGYHVLSVNYFDDYDYTGAPSTFTTVMHDNSQNVYYNNSTHKPKGLATGSWMRIVEASTVTPVKADVSSVLYDKKARAVRNRTDNYLTGYTQTDTKIDFAGRVLVTETKHKRTSGDTEIYTRDDFAYTNQDRLLTNIHKIGLSGTPQLINKNTYDQLGKLISKKVGGTDVTTFAGLQNVHYTYNIRGWLTEINNTANLTVGSDPQDLFAFKINYNTVNNEDDYTGTALYNRNISETYWRTSSDNTLRKYGYLYDDMNRLKTAIYLKPGQTNARRDSYNESLTYDKNGNIKTLQRYGDFDDPVTPLLIDNLSYFYASGTNTLMKVTDATNNTIGFKDDSNGTNDTADDYAYDANGNMVSDQNKTITSIKYNHMNLPVEIVFTGTNKKINYLYNGAGIKVEKKVTNGSTVTITDYLDGGFQYTKVGSAAVALQFFPHAGGYVSNSSGVYNYVFNYKDHLGNNRLSYTLDPSTQVLTILEENHYYPFGLKHSKYNIDQAYYDNGGSKVITVPRLPYQYKYQGQEFQDELGLNWNSFKWRNYDPAMARFMSIDPLSEKYMYNSLYAFQENKMGIGRELEGLEVLEFAKDAWKGFVTESKAIVNGTVNLAFNPVGVVVDNVVSISKDVKKGDYKSAVKKVVSITHMGTPAISENIVKTTQGDGKAFGKLVAQGLAVVATEGISRTVNSVAKTTSTSTSTNSNVITGSSVTENTIKTALEGSKMKTIQSEVSLPVIQRYVDKINAGEVPPPIKVADGVIVDGNHRFVAGEITGSPPSEVPSVVPNSMQSEVRLVKEMNINPIDYGNQ